MAQVSQVSQAVGLARVQTQLTPSQQRAIDVIKEGKNIFLTGAGGTGKSFLIAHIKRNFGDPEAGHSVAVTALTGCAAVLLGDGAKTIHSWAGIGLGKEDADTLIAKIRKNKKALRNWKKAYILIIDEISMMPPDLLEKLDRIAKVIRGMSQPFGGIQVILSGDFFQLPPVSIGAPSKFAFESPIWNEIIGESVILTESKRQSDPLFQDILSATRQGKVTPEHITVLKKRIGLPWNTEPIQPTILSPRRADVDTINEKNIARLLQPHNKYIATTVRGAASASAGQEVIDLNDPAVIAQATAFDKNAPYQTELVLAEGAQVMLVYNLDIENGLVNGSRGVVVGFSASQYPIVQFKHVRRTIEYQLWPLEDMHGVARKQIPLIVAYAQTIHKCQGATLDCALIDIGSNIFEYGQAYVALSRVKSLDSLHILRLDPAALTVNPKVVAFYNTITPVAAPAQVREPDLPASEPKVKISGSSTSDMPESTDSPIVNATKMRSKSVPRISKKAITAQQPPQPQEPAQEPILANNPDRFTLFPIKYPVLYNRYKQQVAVFWTPEEVDLSKDLKDWDALDDNKKHFIKHILGFFHGSDGIVMENLSMRFSTEVQIPEARAFYAAQNMMESIHSETYALLIDTYIDDKDEKLRIQKAIETIPCVKKKAEWAQKWIESRDEDFATRLVAFAIIEGVFFSGAFCAIYWLKEQGIMPGLTLSNEFISRDEGLHTDFACDLYKELKNKLSKDKIHKIMREAVKIEKEFITKSLPVSLIGMNSKLMSEYIEFVADRLCSQLGYPKVFYAKNPFSFMERISLESKGNFFETRNSNYAKSGVGVAKEKQVFATDEDF